MSPMDQITAVLEPAAALLLLPVTLALPKFNFPSTVPSMNRSSLPVISPLIRIPCVMHAAARGETGSAAGIVLLTGKLTGAVTVLGCEMTGPGAGVCGAACGLAS